MAKSSKTSKDATAAEPLSAGSAPIEQGIADASVSESPKAKKSARTSGKKSAASKRKPSTAAKTRKAAAPKKAEPVEFTISDEDIRLRAYFIAQHRALSGLAGDSAGDWLEARRQLFEEASRTA